ncbi:hypothetical protein K493DRAFT_345929 [Basidiobolus meristosporus CBS 931.73]|uniref:Uncharacterized protein n=1 Tax=Basidiobolus meristosporus CBS 931.73 TaxID=1314790 RepID=A0A1Y1Z0S0_9FUNG|nr:hypothetical protein K493DRAFT_345929 [Basidiobolus meristosporus CBS 931.73]|eukprot:ORY03890.1 hypothetical protein K493DRAFT_345929 [Basidiobolus meristosporus CBS 931.73]
MFNFNKLITRSLSLKSRRHTRERCSYCREPHSLIQCEIAICDLENILWGNSASRYEDQTLNLTAEKEFEMEVAKFSGLPILERKIPFETMNKLQSLFSRKQSKQGCPHCQGAHRSTECELAIQELERILNQLDSRGLEGQSVSLTSQKEFEMDMAQIAASTHKLWYRRFENQDFVAPPLA